MFHYDAGLVLTAGDLAIDVRRRRPRAFISHAHYDHLAGHELALCTPETAALYRLRCGQRQTLPLPYRQPVEFHGMRLTTYPAGHCLGSAMLLAEHHGDSLLYTGDFKLGKSETSESAELPHADFLVMESTYGNPRYRLPPREETVAEFIALVREALDSGRTPIILAYPLGKAQEITRWLTAANVAVLQHPDVYRVSRVYVECGVDLGPFLEYSPPLVPGRAVIVPPQRQPRRLPPRERQVRFCVTGWALDLGAKERFGVDHAIPISDHADFEELLAAVDRVQPHIVYCTHGPESFVEHLRDAGWEAYPLGKQQQMRLFR